MRKSTTFEGVLYLLDITKAKATVFRGSSLFKKDDS